MRALVADMRMYVAKRRGKRYLEAQKGLIMGRDDMRQ